MKEFESLIEMILINNFDCSQKKLFPFYLPTLCIRPKGCPIHFVLQKLTPETTQIDGQGGGHQLIIVS